jgi:hypothetical protein
MAVRVGRDSTTAADIPLPGLQVVMGYGNGRFAWTDKDWARFPATVARARIDVNASDPRSCGILDVERGDAQVGQVPAWVKTRRSLGSGATGCTIYCDRATRPAVLAVMDGQGLRLAKDYTLWIATLDGTRTLPDMTGVVAVQWGGAMTMGGHYDQSAVYDDAWHPVPVVAPPAPSWQAEALKAAESIDAAAQALARQTGALMMLLKAHQ